MKFKELLLPGVAWLALVAAPMHSSSFAQEQGQEAARPTDLLSAQGRVQVVAPNQPLRLGEKTAIEVRIQGPKVLKIFSMQALAEVDAVPGPAVKGGEQELTLDRHADGSTWVTLVPEAIGEVRIAFIFIFADGGMDLPQTTVHVAPDGPPSGLQIEAGGPVVRNVLFMDLSPAQGKRRLWTSATYPGVAAPLYISDKDLRFRVTTNKGLPAIRLDAGTATIEALRLGHALIEVS